MADKRNSLNYEVRELKLGASFTNNKASQYHTIKYDFKPASVDVNKMATVDVGTNNQVTVTVPHLDNSGIPQTVFKGSQRPYTKECVLIIDRVTGEITLEKLSSNIQVKKTRQETSRPRAAPLPAAPPGLEPNTTARSSSRTRVATTRRAPPPGPAGAAAGGAASGRYNSTRAQPGLVRSPPRQRASSPQAPWSSGGNSTLASLPMIGLDDAGPAHANQAAHPVPPAPPAHPMHPAPPAHPVHPAHPTLPTLPVPPAHQAPPVAPHHRQPVPAAAPAADSSSSSSSDSGSDSDSNSDSDDNEPETRQVNGATLPSDVLNDDLCLSDSSGSDSD